MKDMILYSAVVILLLLVFSVYAEAATLNEGGTSVAIRPGRINTMQCGSVIGKIYIRTDSPGRYRISIDGVPDEWLDYPKSVHVADEETVSYVLNPSESGKYDLTFTVKGGGETFELEGTLWVGSNQPDVNGYEKTSGEDGMEGGGTGMFVLSEENQALFMVMAVAVAAVFAVLLGRVTLKREDGQMGGYVY